MTCEQTPLGFGAFVVRIELGVYSNIIYCMAPERSQGSDLELLASGSTPQASGILLPARFAHLTESYNPLGLAGLRVQD